MTSFQLFEAIGIIDDTLIAEVNNSSYKKQRKICAVAVLTACAMLAVCVFVNRDKLHQNQMGDQMNEIQDCFIVFKSKVWRKIESSVRKSMAKTIWHGRLPGGA